MNDDDITSDGLSLMLGDCLERMAEIADGSVNLICSDPPYMNVKQKEAWDRQWKTPAAFLEWMGRLCVEWKRVLAPNGSLYVFASPRMAARVECKVGESFEVLNRITWRKDAGWAKRQCKEEQRSYFPASEAIIFAEHFGADSTALGESGYAAKCETLRGFVYGAILDYLTSEFKAARLSRREVDDHFGTSNVSQYWLQPRGFIIPTAEKWTGLQAIRPHHFRREYQDLRREYQDLRRPFAVSAAVPYTDVWDYPTVPHRPGKHPCQKPIPLLSHIITASSRPGDLVLDSFMGSGTTGESALSLGRRFIGIEKDEKWFASAARRIAGAAPVAHIGDRRADMPRGTDEPARAARKATRGAGPRYATPMFRFLND